MKKLSLFITIFLMIYNIKAQDSGTAFLLKKTLPIKGTTLIRLNGKYNFKTNNWTSVKDKDVIAALCGIIEGKDKEGNIASNPKILGRWKISETQIAYIYTYTIKGATNNKIAKVFLSTYKDEIGKTEDIDPFGQNPNPTGMSGKIIHTDTLKINHLGKIKLTTTHKTGSGKVLKKENNFYVDENGKMIISN